MRFIEENPNNDYRKNLALHALLKIETFYELANAASPELRDKVKKNIDCQDKLCEMVSNIAIYYLAREPLVPLLFVESIEEEILSYPFTQDEIAAVLGSKIGDALLT